MEFYDGQEIETEYLQTTPKLGKNEALLYGLKQGLNYTLYQGALSLKSFATFAGMPQSQLTEKFFDDTKKNTLARIAETQKEFDYNKANIEGKGWVKDLAFGVGSMANPLSVLSMYAGGGLAKGISTAGTKLGLNFINGAAGKIATQGISQAITNQDQLILDNITNKSITGKYLSAEDNIQRAKIYAAFGAGISVVAEPLSWVFSKKFAAKKISNLSDIDIKKIDSIQKSIDNLPNGKSKKVLTDMFESKLKTIKGASDTLGDKSIVGVVDDVISDIVEPVNKSDIPTDSIRQLNELSDLVYKDLLDGRPIDYIKKNYSTDQLIKFIETADKIDVDKLADLNSKKIDILNELHDYIEKVNEVGTRLNDDLDTLDSVTKEFDVPEQILDDVVENGPTPKKSKDIKSIKEKKIQRLNDLADNSKEISEYISKDKKNSYKIFAKNLNDIDGLAEIISKQTGETIEKTKKYANSILSDVKVKKKIIDLVDKHDEILKGIDEIDTRFAEKNPDLGKGFVSENVLSEVNRVPDVDDLLDVDNFATRIEEMYKDVDLDATALKQNKELNVLDTMSKEADDMAEKFKADNKESIEARIIDEEANIEKIIKSIDEDGSKSFTLQEAKQCLADALKFKGEI